MYLDYFSICQIKKKTNDFRAFLCANSKIAFMCITNVRKYIDVGIGPIILGQNNADLIAL